VIFLNFGVSSDRWCGWDMLKIGHLQSEVYKCGNKFTIPNECRINRPTSKLESIHGVQTSSDADHACWC